MERIVVRNIPGFPGYGATRDGRIWSDKRGGHWMRPGRDRGGYLLVDLYQGGKRTTKRVHRLVAEAFLPNPEEKPEINHVNGDKEDNRVCNLEWATRAENIQHAYGTGLSVGVTGEAHGLSKLTWVQAREIRERYAAGGTSQRDLGAEYGVSDVSVGDIVNGKTWRET